MNRITLYFKASLWLCFSVLSTMTQAQELIPYRKGALWGYADANKKVVVAPQYGMVYKFSEGLSLVSKGGKYGYIDATGKEVIACNLDEAGAFQEGAALTKVGTQDRLIDKSGKVLLASTDAYSFATYSEGLLMSFAAERPGAYVFVQGLMDRSGKQLAAPQYKSIRRFQEGMAAVEKDSKWGFIDKMGKELVAPTYKEVGDFSEGLAWVKTAGGDIAYIDATGKEVIPAKYSLAENFSEGWARVGVFEGGKIQRVFIDKSGKTVWKPEYEQVKDLKDGLIAFKKEGKWGFCNAKGKEVVRLNGKWGFIDEKGKEAIAPKYSDCYGGGFKAGMANVKFNGYTGYINKKGQEYWED